MLRIFEKALGGSLLEALNVLVQQPLLLQEDAHGGRGQKMRAAPGAVFRVKR